MAFRSKAEACSRLIAGLLFVSALSAQSSPYEVRHRHLRHGSTGILRIGDNAISFAEQGGKIKHSREWRYEDIQELVLGPDTLRILTYEDQRWKLGRDREFVFDHLPKKLVEQAYSFFGRRLDQRFVAALADDQVKPLWQTPAKLLHGRGGSEGVLLVGLDHIVYQSAKVGESRTWRIGDIENVNSAGPFDLTITTYERATSHYGERKDFRFQLKQFLQEAQYNDFWRRVNRSKELQILTSAN